MNFDKISSLDDAIRRVQDGDRVMVGGFGNAGNPEGLIEGLVRTGAKDLTIISNDLGSPDMGLGRLLTNGQVRALIGNYYNWNPEVAQAFNEKKIQVTLIPQGSFAEAIRAAGVGIPAFFTPTSAGTDLAKGKEAREFNGRLCVLEKAIHADIALVRAHLADELGNLTYYKTACNFNPLMAMAATTTIAEVDRIVPAGDLDPQAVITPHLFVDYMVRKEMP